MGGQESLRTPHTWKTLFTESQCVCNSHYYLLGVYCALATSLAQSKQGTAKPTQPFLPQADIWVGVCFGWGGGEILDKCIYNQETNK